jgi:hypothetical protein
MEKVYNFLKISQSIDYEEYLNQGNMISSS